MFSPTINFSLFSNVTVVPSIDLVSINNDSTSFNTLNSYSNTLASKSPKSIFLFVFLSVIFKSVNKSVLLLLFDTLL